MRVAVVASGGLSHPIINEKLDRQVMTAIRAGNSETLINLPRTALRGGAGQILDWITMVGAVGGLNNQWAEYWPVYRTPGGTGIDLAFASWF
jgi:3-O-methylgallate 3,4-dioxygenase